jgi:hypothetical protein
MDPYLRWQLGIVAQGLHGQFGQVQPLLERRHRSCDFGGGEVS